MSKQRQDNKVQMIEISRINILNPRSRNKKVFGAIAENIAQVGLKRPITVTASHAGLPGKTYDLVCGQGRLEAFINCKQTHIPAIIIEASEEEALVMSLIENCARPQHKATELFHAVEILREKGYASADIALKIGVTEEYVDNILRMIDKGEERLVAAVESGQMAMSIALKIAAAGDGDTQALLHELYETKQLRGSKLLSARLLIENRRQRGKAFLKTSPNEIKRRIASADDILKVYQKEARRKHMLTRKAAAVNSHLLFITEALKRLLQDEHFTTLLKAEGIVTMPKPLSTLVNGKE